MGLSLRQTVGGQTVGGRWTLRIANPASGTSVKATCMLERAGLGEGGGGSVDT